jgi:urease accessory protein
MAMITTTTVMTVKVMTTRTAIMATIMSTKGTIMIIITPTARHATTSMTTLITATPIRIVMGRSKAPRPRTTANEVGAASADAAEYAALYRLMTWLSPSFPVGAFSYSSGIEWAVEAGDIGNAGALQDWLAAMLSDGPGFCDGVFLCHAWRASTAHNDAALAEVSELAAAFAPSRERHLETTAQGRAFAAIAGAAWPCAALDQLLKISAGPVAYPVAVGAVAAGHAVRLDLALHAYLHAQTANWISAGVRLIPLGQTESQRVMAALEPVVASTATRARDAALDDIGSATFRADLASMRHETQYTRLFRT